ncbi:uncharacterized protein LOC130012550 [Patella vulgata]|uniref:uncharacterized protein LOC130012550 n=1 Tax=Patella vulgata TaxID=6465 RepID=UPI0024A7FFD2|nr:uncharacterized protein LOC130012550 [Patella vulgata]
MKRTLYFFVCALFTMATSASDPVDPTDQSAYGSVKSRSAKNSERSSKRSSVISLKLIQAAEEAAVIEQKLKYHSIEAEKKLELENIQLRKDLDIANAKVNALRRFENEDFKVESMIPVCEQNKSELVATFVNSHNFSTDYGDPPHLSPAVNPINPVSSISKPVIPASSPLVFLPPPQIPVSDVYNNTPPMNNADHSHASQSAPAQVSSAVHVPASDLVRILTDQANFNRLPPPEPGVFSGDPLKYPNWKCAFKTLIEHKNIPKEQCMHYLHRYISLKMQSHCLKSDMAIHLLWLMHLGTN